MKAEGEAELLGKQVAELQSQVNGLKLQIDVRSTFRAPHTHTLSSTFPTPVIPRLQTSCQQARTLQ